MRKNTWSLSSLKSGAKINEIPIDFLVTITTSSSEGVTLSIRISWNAVNSTKGDRQLTVEVRQNYKDFHWPHRKHHKSFWLTWNNTICRRRVFHPFQLYLTLGSTPPLTVAMSSAQQIWNSDKKTKSWWAVTENKKVSLSREEKITNNTIYNEKRQCPRCMVIKKMINACHLNVFM